jgi:hypothetical protein
LTKSKFFAIFNTMRKIILLLLFLYSFGCCCSPFFTTQFCQEIDFWNSNTVKYKYFEIAPNWVKIAEGYQSFTFTIRF